MQPAAHISAAIEILDAAWALWAAHKNHPLDELIARYMSSRRYIGSKDRRAISDVVYATMRRWGMCYAALQQSNLPVSARLPVLAAAAMCLGQSVKDIDQHCSGVNHAPQPLSGQEREWLVWALHCGLNFPDASLAAQSNMPDWLWKIWHQQFGKDAREQALAFAQEASPILRVNSLRKSREKVMRQLHQEGTEAHPTRFAAHGISLAKRLPKDHPLLAQGLVEIQEEASQICVELMEVKPNMQVLDLCAGAGGKTLAIAAAMQGKGRIVSCDVDERRLQELRRRAKRAGVETMIETYLLPVDHLGEVAQQLGRFDRILIDSPCSGLGTWRRNPDLVWRLQPEQLAQLQQVQSRLLRQTAPLLAAGGILTYATCSVLAQENNDIINQYLVDNRDFRVAPANNLWSRFSVEQEQPAKAWLTLTPKQHQTDGFFIASLHRA